MSKRSWIAFDTLLTFWPPGPCARIAVNSICEASGVSRGSRLASIIVQSYARISGGFDGVVGAVRGRSVRDRLGGGAEVHRGFHASARERAHAAGDGDQRAAAWPVAEDPAAGHRLRGVDRH